jgi:hypothetical protein
MDCTPTANRATGIRLHEKSGGTAAAREDVSNPLSSLDMETVVAHRKPETSNKIAHLRDVPPFTGM